MEDFSAPVTQGQPSKHGYERHFTKRGKEHVISILGAKAKKSMEPWFQMASVNTDLWTLMSSILQKEQTKPTSTRGKKQSTQPKLSDTGKLSAFKAMQGLHLSTRYKLLAKIAAGDLSWQELSQEAQNIMVPLTLGSWDPKLFHLILSLSLR